ncbi:Class II Aldolase and Adducin N-terminal domain-containing protein [Brevinema andersonii]|uniref:Class II Aldolase and Adducin N-terminal domain-containing protein n=1 Tax=Brevinema andersonii TaxID=34097 RepID=A0A1I1D3G7_BREAD|nr:class II aldolase/adducin family protein [Brevinema andersonii]SFB68912.1 Class II Aldolase and Adducin N-terminal domain-containing protein [Brevinema andersonii]
MEPISSLCKLSANTNTDAVQGAGGNASVKYGNMLYIKASGTRLKDMNFNQGWTIIDLPEWRKGFTDFQGGEEEFNILTDRCTTGNELASIEIGLHALLPQTFILHTHSAYSCVFLCSGKTQELTAYISPLAEADIFTVEACVPGLQLTQNLNKTIQQKTHSENSITLLENHGIATASLSINKVLTLHQELHENLQKKFQLPLFVEPVVNEDLKWNAEVYVQGIEYFLNKQALLFPDQAVYIDNKILSGAIEFQGSTVVFKNHSLKNAQNTAEILALVLYLYQTIPQDSLCFLDKAIGLYITSMSREKYRQNMEKL